MVSIVRFPKDPGLKTFSPSSSPLVPFVLSRIGAAMKEGKLTTFTIANWQGHVKEQRQFSAARSLQSTFQEVGLRTGEPLWMMHKVILVQSFRTFSWKSEPAIQVKQ